ncbi:hypothetical protein MIMGU_mgv11b021584mg, partial [Erythranthe guttata]
QFQHVHMTTIMREGFTYINASWTNYKPLNFNLWLTIFVANIFTGIVIWIIEYRLTVVPKMRSTVGIGLVLDMNSTFGTMVNMCMDMAVSDFYKAHPNHITRLQLHKKDAKSVLDVNVAGR